MSCQRYARRSGRQRNGRRSKWTQSLVRPFPKKGNLRKCKIRHPSKLHFIRPNTKAEELVLGFLTYCQPHRIISGRRRENWQVITNLDGTKRYDFFKQQTDKEYKYNDNGRNGKGGGIKSVSSGSSPGMAIEWSININYQAVAQPSQLVFSWTHHSITILGVPPNRLTFSCTFKLQNLW